MDVGHANRRCRRDDAVHRLCRRGGLDGHIAWHVHLLQSFEMDLGNCAGLYCQYHRAFNDQWLIFISHKDVSGELRINARLETVGRFYCVDFPYLLEWKPVSII